MKRLEMIQEKESVDLERNRMVTRNVTMEVTQLYANVLKLKLKVKMKLLKILLKSPIRAGKQKPRLRSRWRRST